MQLIARPSSCPVLPLSDHQSLPVCQYQDFLVLMKPPMLQGNPEGADSQQPLDKVCHCGEQAREVDIASFASSPPGGLAHGDPAEAAS